MSSDSYNPKISVAMACYNADKYVKDAIKSIYNQSYTNWEIIFVDDYSEDNTLHIINKYISELKIEEKCRIVRHNYRYGYGTTLYDAIKYGNGELVAVIDSDDALATKHAFKIMVQAHNDNPGASLCYSTYYFCRNKLKTEWIKDVTPLPEGKTYLDVLLNPKKKKNGKGIYCRISHLKVFKRELYNKTPGLKRGLQKAIDRDLVLKLEEVGELVFINKPLYIHRKHDGNITNLWGSLNNAERKEIMKDKQQMIKDAIDRRRENIPDCPRMQ